MEVVKVKRALVKACLTCPLCKKLLQDATTISECLHTFCRKCIYEKLTDEEMECCPMCNIELGCSAVEKLRTDHNLQDVRIKIFPLKRRKVSAPEIATILLPVRKKERSLSSLVSTPRTDSNASLAGRKAKSSARKAGVLRGVVSSTTIKEDIIEESPGSSSSPEVHIKATQHRRESSSNAEPSDYLSNKIRVVDEIPSVGKGESWKPLNCLVEAANRTKSLKYNLPGSVPKSEQTNGQGNEVDVNKKLNKFTSIDEKDGSMASASKRVKRLHGSSRKRAAAAMELRTSAQALLDASVVRREGCTSPIWLSLMASATSTTEVALPQISAYFLRIKDGNLPASFIQKYVAKKLEISNETEVDITCRGQPVAPTLELNKLADLWLRTTSSQKAQAEVGSSAKDFVMVLNYARKLPPAPSSIA